MQTEQTVNGYRMSNEYGYIDYVNEGYGKYGINLHMNVGEGNQALPLLRESFDYLFDNTDCLIIYGRIDDTDTFTKQVGDQIEGVIQEPKEGISAIKKWTIGSYRRAKGLLIDQALKDMKRALQVRGVLNVKMRGS